jgi:hypothetical protein
MIPSPSSLPPSEKRITNILEAMLPLSTRLHSADITTETYRQDLLLLEALSMRVVILIEDLKGDLPLRDDFTLPSLEVEA